jgi:NADPH2:quinone reductase
MPHAIRIHAHGDPGVLRFEEVALSAPGPGEARVRHTTIGVNYIDTYHRTGVYKVPFPSGIGMEAAGIVEAVGPGVEIVAPGDRVAYCNGPLGAYSEARVMPAIGWSSFRRRRGSCCRDIMLKSLLANICSARPASSKRATRSCFRRRAASASSPAGGRAPGGHDRTAGSDEKAALAKANGSAIVTRARTSSNA